MGARGIPPNRTTLYVASVYIPETQRMINKYNRSGERIESWMAGQRDMGRRVTFFAEYKLKEVMIDGERTSSTAR